MILAGDTGGTKTLLALFDGGAMVRDEIFHCAEFASLEAIVAHFLGDSAPALTAAAFGVAGPVLGRGLEQAAKITNLPWSITARGLAAQLGGIPVALLNDLQATALGALVLPADAFAVLQPAQAGIADGTIAVIAPGTGLGEALLVHDGGGYRALPSEGGHADFAPTTDEEIELLRYLRVRHAGHVSYERVLSGDGLGDLYGFCRASGRFGAPGDEPGWLTQAIAAGDRNAAIAQAGLAGKDPACARAVAMFAEILGGEAGNLALRGLTTGGVVIGGGIPPKLLPALTAGGLIERFNDKGRFAPWTRGLGVRVCLEPRAALFGAAHHAATLPTHATQERPKKDRTP
jgi:glucokinase